MSVAPHSVPTPAHEGVIEQVTRELASRSAAILVRIPAIDPRYPDTSDLDFLIVTDTPDFRSERMQVRVPGTPATMIDVASLPWKWFDAPEAMAARGWVPHRLLSSELVFDSGRDIAGFLERMRASMYDPLVHEKRLHTFLDIGFQTVREIGITWDFPPLALFWLHMAHAACLGAALDGMRRLCPNVYTRPFEHLDALERHGATALRSAWVDALHLDADLETTIAALQRVHAVVTAKFPEPEWPDTIRTGTRYEYRYWLSSAEVSWRISAAREMARRHERAGAIFYLRFCAYAVARLPMLHARARAGGHDVSFLRPEKAVLPELKALVPEIVHDLQVALAGTSHLDVETVKSGLSMLYTFRELVLGCLRDCRAPMPEPGTWAPFEPSRI